MKKIILFSFLVFSFTVFAQKVKFKKEVIYVDDNAVFHYENAGGNIIIYTLDDKDLISIAENAYEEKNPNHFNSNNPSAYKYPPYIKKSFSTVTFLKNGKQMYTDLSDKELVIKLIKADLIDNEGKLNEEKVDLFINKYNNENLVSKLGSNTVIIQNQSTSAPRTGINIGVGIGR